MKITKEDGMLVLRVPLEQMSYDALGDEIGLVPNVTGYSDGKEFSINQLISLGYKDDIQLGMPIVFLSSIEELQEVVKEIGIGIWEYDRCFDCDNVLLGSFTFNKDSKPVCLYGCKKI